MKLTFKSPSWHWDVAASLAVSVSTKHKVKALPLNLECLTSSLRYLSLAAPHKRDVEWWLTKVTHELQWNYEHSQNEKYISDLKAGTSVST